MDFDGDAMGLMLATDQKMVNLIEPLRLHKSAFDISRYRGLTSNCAISKPVIATQAAAMRHGDVGVPTEAMDVFLA